MYSRKRIGIIAAAIFVGVPCLAIGGFFVVLTLDERRVEAKAEDCKALIPAIQDFRNRAGRFPAKSEAAQMDPKLVEDCGYSNAGAGFSMGLAGAGMNLQVYSYSSETNRWFWD